MQNMDCQDISFEWDTVFSTRCLTVNQKDAVHDLREDQPKTKISTPTILKLATIPPPTQTCHNRIIINNQRKTEQKSESVSAEYAPNPTEVSRER